MEFSRPTWDEYFTTIAVLTSKRSNCLKRKVGCIVVKDQRILSLGYNGTPKGMKNCYQGGCPRCMEALARPIQESTAKHLDLCMCLHAEENALLFLSKQDLAGATIYVTLMPCISCAKKIIQCEIGRVVYIDNYEPRVDEISLNMLKSSEIQVEQVQKTEKIY